MNERIVQFESINGEIDDRQHSKYYDSNLNEKATFTKLVIEIQELL